MSTPTYEFANPFADPVANTEAKQDTSGVVSSAGSSSPTVPGDKSKGKKRVGFTGRVQVEEPSGTSSVGEISPRRPQSPGVLPVDGSSTPQGGGMQSGQHSRQGSGDLLLGSIKSHLPELSPLQTDQLRVAISRGLDTHRPRPAIRRGSSTKPELLSQGLDDDGPRARSARAAFERGKRLERTQLIHSAPASRQSSPRRSSKTPDIGHEGIPLQDLEAALEDVVENEPQSPSRRQEHKMSHAEAYNLVKRHTVAHDDFHSKSLDEDAYQSPRTPGAVTPIEDLAFMDDYQPRPKKFRRGILGTILKLHHDPQRGGAGRSWSGPDARRAHVRGGSTDYSAMSTPAASPPDSGTSTPKSGVSTPRSGVLTPNGRRSWYRQRSTDQSTGSLATLVGSSSAFGTPVVSGLGEKVSKRLREQQREQQMKRPSLGQRTHSGHTINSAFRKLSRPSDQDHFRITKHIAETMSRQKYLLRLCKALMLYGAPTHRLEEYMTMSARVLEIDAQFLYIPGAMIVSFEDSDTHTSEVKLVKVAQGLDLGKLRDVHELYKEVIHDRMSVDDALVTLKEVVGRKPKHNRLLRVPVYGLAAVCVGPFAFSARLIDLPIAFFLGCILGFLQLYVAPASELYANVFEITAAVITSFLARAFGSIRGGSLFCFSALAQSSIALILPGYLVLCASLELQSRSIVAGSVRMVYAIIYSLFLGFGITIGTAIYGLLDSNATSATTCEDPIDQFWFFFFVPGFTLCLIIINQAKWKQAPVMMVIAFAGYVVNYFSSQRFAGNTQVSNTLGALCIGVMANLYSRIGGKVENMCWDLWEGKLRHKWTAFRKRVFGLQNRKESAKALEESSTTESTFKPAVRRVGYGLAAAAMLPAIFVQVPSGLSVNGSLVSGIASADQITGNATNGTQVVNSTTISTAYDGLNSIAFTVGYSVIQVAIGITVGLFLSAIVVYPFGKRRSGLFSF